MKTTTSLTALMLGASLLVAPAFAEDVTVTLTGVKAAGGEILVSLQTQDQFLKPAGTYGAKAAAPAKDGTVTLVIKGVAPGTYSMSALHDQNNDRQMAMGANGMPGEGWAMHNGTMLQAAPTWGDVSFVVGAAPVALTEPMIYPQ